MKNREAMSGRRDAMTRCNGQLIHGPRIAIAIGIGILIGLVFAFLYPDSFLHRPEFSQERLDVSSFQGNSANCGSLDWVRRLKSELSELSKKNEKLNKQIRKLRTKLQIEERKNYDHLKRQFPALEQRQKAGPFGTVKSVRTNPTVLPNSTVNPRLQGILEKVAINKEIIVALANIHVKDTLVVWFKSIKNVGIPNYLVVALDDETERLCTREDVPVYRRNPDESVDFIAKMGNNHAISGLKFQILREFLQIGYSVLLSDIDVVYLQNPFDHLYRDCDVESMTDGHNNDTAYGYDAVFDEPSMGWSRYAHTMRIWVYNSGFFFIRPTIPSIELLDRVAQRLANARLWDQAVFNEELFYPSHDEYEGLHASRRTMDFYQFMNSKVLFKTVRKDPNLAKIKPVVVHINYHPDKLPRMKAVVDFYMNGKQDALKNFPDGSSW